MVGEKATTDITVAKDAEGFSGADLEALVREAGLNAMRKDINTAIVTKKDFEDALKNSRPSVTNEMNAFYESVMKKRKTNKMEEDILYTG